MCKASVKLKNLIPVIGAFMLLLPINNLFGQACISGKLTDAATGKAIQGASIWIKGQKGISTDQEGVFKLCDLPADSVEMKISFVGYDGFQNKILLRPGMNELKVISLNPAAVQMGEFVVTATRTDNQVLNIPLRVNVIPGRLLENVPMQNVDDVIKLAPGINYSRPFGIFSSKAIVMMRGLSGKEQGRVLVLLDGVPLNKSDGGTVDWNLVDINSVKKVEITKGAGSAIYGGNAMGGIINVITKPPVEKLFMKASVEYGTYNTMGGKLNIGGTRKMKNPSNSFYWLANTWAKKSDGYITQSEADQKINPYITRSNMKEIGANLKTGYSLGSKHSLVATLNYYNDHRGTGEKEFQPDGNVTDHDSYGGTIRYTGKIRELNVNSSLYLLTENYKKVNEYIKDDYTWYNVLSVRRDYGWFTTISGKAGKRQLLTGGFDYRNGSVDAHDKYYTSTDIVYNKGKMGTYALFLQDEIQLTAKFRAIAGLRYDMATFYDGAFYIEAPSVETSFMRSYEVPDMPVQHYNALSPRISLQYAWKTNSRLYAMYSRGYRPSVLDDLCRSGRIKGGFKIANPAVKPEYLNNWETGMDMNLLQNVSLSASVFYTLGTDFQYYVSNGQTIDMGFGARPIFVRANISKVEIYGLETELKWELNSSFSIFGNYSYSHSKILDYQKIANNDTIDLSGKYLTDVPANIFSAGLIWSNRFVNTGLSVHYTGAMYINDQNTVDEILLSDQYPGYTTVDLKFSHRFYKKYNLGLNIQNLFDKKYYDSKDAVCPGRFITAEFSVNL